MGIIPRNLELEEEIQRCPECRKQRIMQRSFHGTCLHHIIKINAYLKAEADRLDREEAAIEAGKEMRG